MKVTALALLIVVFAATLLLCNAASSVELIQRSLSKKQQQQQQPNKFSSPTRADYIAFIEGFALGVESDFGNVTECVQDGKEAFTYLSRSVQELKDGIHRKSVSAITAGIIDLGFGIKELGEDIKACDIKEIIDDIMNIAHQLSSGPSGIVEVIVKEVVNIFHHGKDITNDFKNLISFWEQQKYELAGVQLGKIVGILIKEQ